MRNIGILVQIFFSSKEKKKEREKLVQTSSPKRKGIVRIPQPFMEIRSEKRIQLGVTGPGNGKSETKITSLFQSSSIPQLIFLIIHHGQESTGCHLLLWVIEHYPSTDNSLILCFERKGFIKANNSVKARQHTHHWPVSKSSNLVLNLLLNLVPVLDRHDCIQESE